MLIKENYGITWHLSAELFLMDDEDHDEDEVGIHLQPEHGNHFRFAFINSKLKPSCFYLILYL